MELEIRRDLIFNPNTGILYRRGRQQLLPVGTNRQDGYMCIRFHNTYFLVHRIGWFLHYGAWPSGDLDHKNGIRNDNRISNLREVTSQQNSRNRSKLDNGVSWDKDTLKWRARITAQGKNIYLGCYDSKEEAIRARQLAEEYHYSDLTMEVTR